MTRNLNNVAWLLLLAIGLAVAVACSSSTTPEEDDSGIKEDSSHPASKS
jgi:hypothetical protein